MFSVTISVLTILVAFQVTGSVAQQTAPELIKINGNSYYISTQKQTWINSLLECRRMKLQALSFDTLDDYRAVANYLTSKNRTEWFWTAGQNLDTVSKFFWINNNKSMDVAPWSPGNPSPSLNDGREACVHMMPDNGDWKFNDLYCNGLINFICKGEPAMPFPTPTSPTIDWCDPDLCQGSTRKTAACLNPNKQWASKCSPDAKMMDIDSKIIEAILDKHNSYRNDVAGGVKYPQFKPAARMMTLKWSNNLAYQAATNTMQCEMKHDACFGTPDYKLAGQNLAAIGVSSAGNINVTDLAMREIDSLFSEYKDTTMTEINSCDIHTKNGAVIGHFTQMMQDRADAVGCGMSTYTQDDWSWSLMACNYGHGNMLGSPVYVTDTKPGTKCTTGMNPKYPNLCSEKEVVTY